MILFLVLLLLMAGCATPCYRMMEHVDCENVQVYAQQPHLVACIGLKNVAVFVWKDHTVIAQMAPRRRRVG